MIDTFSYKEFLQTNFKWLLKTEDMKINNLYWALNNGDGVSGALHTSCVDMCVCLDIYHSFCASVYGLWYVLFVNMAFPGVWRGIKERGGKGLSITFSMSLLIFESSTKKWILILRFTKIENHTHSGSYEQIMLTMFLGIVVWMQYTGIVLAVK